MNRSAPVAAILAVLVAAGCSVAAEDAATVIEREAVPFDLLDPDAPNVVEVAGGRTVSVCLLRDDRLVPVERRLGRDADLRDILASLAGVSDDEAALRLSTAVSGAEEIRDVETAGGIATVDFDASADQALTPDPLATIAQVVCTLTAQPGIGSVRFTVAGDAIDVPRQDGSLTDAPVARDDYAGLLAAG